MYIFGNADYGLYKIGASASPKWRLAVYKSYLPFDVKMVYTVLVKEMKRAEKAAHIYLEDKQTRGEWFRLSPRDIELLQILMAGLSILE